MSKHLSSGLTYTLLGIINMWVAALLLHEGYTAWMNIVCAVLWFGVATIFYSLANRDYVQKGPVRAPHQKHRYAIISGKGPDGERVSAVGRYCSDGWWLDITPEAPMRMIGLTFPAADVDCRTDKKRQLLLDEADWIGFEWRP